MQAKNDMLENTIEELGKSFEIFSGKLLASNIFEEHQEIANAFRETLEIFASLARKVHAESAESNNDVPVLGIVPPIEQPMDSSYAQPLVVNPQLLPEAAPSLDTTGIMMAQRVNMMPTGGASTSPGVQMTAHPASSIGIMLIRSPVLADDYWGGELLSDPHLPFSHRLLRSTMLASNQFLRQANMNKPGNSSMAKAHTYSLRRHNSAALLKISSVGIRVAAMEDQYKRNLAPTLGPEPFQSPGSQEPETRGYFNLDFAHDLGLQLRADMVSDGMDVQDYIDAKEVEDYLGEKGMVRCDQEYIQMRLQADLAMTRSHPSMSEPMLLSISTRSLLRRLMQVSLCLGDSIGFSKSNINSALVASVVQMT